jgi:hypothetical protein
MKLKPHNQPSTSRGSVLVVALVISAIGTLGVLATISVIGARSNLAEAQFNGLTRRIVFNNSKALAREVIYKNYLADDVILTADQTFTAGTTPVWGSVTIGAFDKSAFTFNSAARSHPTGASPIRAFSRDLTVQIGDGTNQYPFQYQMRSYNPALAGDLLSIHPTPEVTSELMRISGDLKVKGRAVFWKGDYYQDASSTMRSKEVILPASNAPKLVLENPDEVAVKPSNFINFTQTVGVVPGGNYYKGELDIVNNATSGANSYFQRLTTFGGHASASGQTGSTDALGPATIPATANDSTLIAAIVNPSNSESSLVGLLASNSPLSSNVIQTLLNRVPAVSDAYLLPLLNSQAPLPDDIMIAMANPSVAVGDTTRRAILNNTGYSYVSDGQGTVSLSLQSPYLPNMLLSNVTRLIIEGQTTAVTADAAFLLQPRAIAVKNSNNLLLTTVRLEGFTNRRRVVLAISQRGVLDNADLVDISGAPSTAGTNQTSFIFNSPSPYVQWKLLTELEGVSSKWNVSSVSTATLFGGIRADHSIRVEGGTLTLDREAETDFIESLVSRNAWIEIYK